jgi:hypothetical protein
MPLPRPAAAAASWPQPCHPSPFGRLAPLRQLRASVDPSLVPGSVPTLLSLPPSLPPCCPASRSCTARALGLRPWPSSLPGITASWRTWMPRICPLRSSTQMRRPRGKEHRVAGAGLGSAAGGLFMQSGGYGPRGHFLGMQVPPGLRSQDTHARSQSNTRYSSVWAQLLRLAFQCQLTLLNCPACSCLSQFTKLQRLARTPCPHHHTRPGNP